MPRRVLLAAVAVAAATMSLPALAGEPQPGIGISAQFAGDVVATTLEAVQMPAPGSNDAPRAIPGYEAHANCTFGGALLPNNTLTIAYGGVATATAVVVPARVSQQVIIDCMISNDAGTHSDTFSFSNGGGVTASAKVVAGWPVNPIKVCGKVRAWYGPTDVVFLDSGWKCAAVLSGGASPK